MHKKEPGTSRRPGERMSSFVSFVVFALDENPSRHQEDEAEALQVHFSPCFLRRVPGKEL
jgi:hypothetical protein